MRSYWSPILLAIAIVVVLGLVFNRQSSAHNAEVTRLLERADSLEREAGRLDTVYLRDTIRLTQFETRWRERVVDVDRWKYDTLEVVRFVYLSDSTIAACRATILTCEQRVGVERSAKLDIRGAFDAHLQSHPSALQRVARDLLIFGAGMGVGSILKR